jgi:predicted double-glycine peptidase
MRWIVNKKLLIFPVVWTLSSPAISAVVSLTPLASGGNYSISISSIAERRFKTIYKQQFDFSCGSATLASLLSFHYNDNVSEYTVFSDMYERGDQQKIKNKGFSLLDMKQYLAQRGYKSNGFKITLNQLEKAQVPAITIINNNGYLHFVIIKASNEQEVLIGDPSVGVKVIPLNDFNNIWENRILFVIQDKKEIASNHYRDQSEWKLRVKAPLGSAVDRSSLGMFNMLQPSSIDF